MELFQLYSKENTIFFCLIKLLFTKVRCLINVIVSLEASLIDVNASLEANLEGQGW